MPKKKKQSRKTTQTQSQKVIVNIGTKTGKKKRGAVGGTVAYRHNLAPTFITAPQVDYTPLLAMMNYQTRTLQPEAITNPVTPLSSATVATAGEMSGQAAMVRAGQADPEAQPKESRRGLSSGVKSGGKQRRPGRTAETFEPNSHMEQRLSAEVKEEGVLQEDKPAQVAVPKPLDFGGYAGQAEVRPGFAQQRGATVAEPASQAIGILQPKLVNAPTTGFTTPPSATGLRSQSLPPPTARSGGRPKIYSEGKLTKDEVPFYEQLKKKPRSSLNELERGQFTSLRDRDRKFGRS